MVVSVALVGVGLVGRDVVEQLSLPAVAAKVRIVSLHTSKRHLLVKPNATVSVDEIKSALSSEQTAPDTKFVSKAFSGAADEVVRSLDQLPRPLVVCDCTSSQDVADSYPKFLAAPGTHVVTPNKKAFSGPESLYRAIQEAQKTTRNMVYQEATVGAGLPVIGPLNDMLATGDRVERIEGVFSGTLSYIFNEWSKPGGGDAPAFSEVVKIAKAKGYTEPHPGDDLNGSDVARKLAILARLVAASSGQSLELPKGYESVQTASLVPEGLESIASGDEFLQRLQEHDGHFETMRKEAAAEGCVLRFVGVVDASAQSVKVEAALRRYPASHPFAASLGGSDNIVSFHTARYSARPLIIQGAGAGAAVTAMGVAADVLKVAERAGPVAS